MTGLEKYFSPAEMAEYRKYEHKNGTMIKVSKLTNDMYKDIVCSMCHKEIKEVPERGGYRFNYGLPELDVTWFDGKRIDFEFESFWVCNDCLEEVKHE